MKENSVPKWQRELRSFLGIKSGIILEGNVYDEFPMFMYDSGSDEVEFDGVDDMNQTILSLVDTEHTEVFFFDPVDGFYCYGDDPNDTEYQKKALKSLLEGYDTDNTVKSHGSNVCFMPCGKEHSHDSDSGRQYIVASEIIRKEMLERDPNSDGKSGDKKENVVFVLNFASRLDACNLQEADSNAMFLNLMMATTLVQKAQQTCNSLILVVDKYNDIPAWVYLNNPNIRTISVCVPDRSTRRLYLENLSSDLAPYQILSREDYEPGKKFVAETEGLKLRELRQIMQLAYKKSISPESISLAFRLYKYGVIDNPWESLENDILVDIEQKLEERVKGQDEAIKKVKTVVTRAVKGLSGLQHSGASHKPKGIFFFAGPTGVGKTETAKALAEAIFGDENACIRFDMSEYRAEHSDQKLFGAPPGYVGYEGGGQLTNSVKNRPFSILLFDEIEKASPTILDKFLQILEDGRMTDNQGNTVYFGETIIIFTSNIGLTKEEEVTSENYFKRERRRVPTITIEDPMVEDTPEFREKVTETLTEGVKAYFTDNGRPELLNRLGENNIVVFQFINKHDAETICDYKLKKICQAIKEDKNIDIIVDGVVDMLHEKAVMKRADGGRGVGNMLEEEFQNPLGEYLATLPEIPAVLKCHANNTENKIEFEVMLGEA
ncbi:MAG: AAA family ATPase [Oscillospiraceae bacterium]|nr:AAA family ATPase [Oscillospiraceae bacterium]